MLDGKYSCSINTPMGGINGTITLQTRGNNVTRNTRNNGNEKSI